MGKIYWFCWKKLVKKKKSQPTWRSWPADQTAPSSHSCSSLGQLPEAVCWHGLEAGSCLLWVGERLVSDCGHSRVTPSPFDHILRKNLCTSNNTAAVISDIWRAATSAPNFGSLFGFSNLNMIYSSILKGSIKQLTHTCVVPALSQEPVYLARKHHNLFDAIQNEGLKSLNLLLSWKLCYLWFLPCDSVILHFHLRTMTTELSCLFEWILDLHIEIH